MDQCVELNDALKLEDIKFGQFLSEAAEEKNSRINALHSDLAAAGVTNSGKRGTAEKEILWDSMQSVICKTIALRKELGVRVPILLTENWLAGLERKLQKYIDSAVAGTRNATILNPRGGGGASTWQDAHFKALALKGKVSHEIATLRLETRLGMHSEERSVTTIKISNSNIAALNLGTVVGDLKASLTNLSSAGQSRLAEALEKFTEAVAKSTELNDSLRKEIIEHLAFVSSEVALPSEKRRMAPFKSTIEGIKSGISVATQLLGLWTAVENALRSIGVL